MSTSKKLPIDYLSLPFQELVKIDFTTLSDEDLLRIYNRKEGGVPRKVAELAHSRKLIKSYKGTFNSNMKP